MRTTCASRRGRTCKLISKHTKPRRNVGKYFEDGQKQNSPGPDPEVSSSVSSDLEEKLRLATLFDDFKCQAVQIPEGDNGEQSF